MIEKKSFGILLRLCLLLPLQAQTASRSRRKVSVSHPSVYLSFFRVGKREPIHTGESDQGVWLRLHNNSRWSLVLNAHGAGGHVFATGKEEEVGMFYGVEEVRQGSGLVRIEPALSEMPQPPAPGSDPDWKKRPDPVSPKIEEDCPLPSDDWCHVCSSIILKPGKSLLFSVPRETLCKNLRIYLVFNYAWETRGNEPEHRVYVYGSELSTGAR